MSPPDGEAAVGAARGADETAALAWPRPAAPWWRAGLTLLRSLTWAVVLCSLLAIGLLLLFGHVVREAVQRNDLEHRAATSRASATWRCQGLPDRLLRQDCLARLNNTALDGATVPSAPAPR